MQDEPGNDVFPLGDFKNLYLEARHRIVDSPYEVGKEFCDLMNKITEFHLSQEEPDNTGIKIACTILPGFEAVFRSTLHHLAHLAFEIGRQYEIESALTDFSDLTVEDLK